jgi:hypothetical protein
MTSILDRIRRNPRVELVDDERAMGNSIIVTLKTGWRFNDPGEHVFGEDTPTECLRSLKRTKPCDCAECEANKEGDVKTLHLKYWRHPVSKKWMSPIARWSETGLVRRG